jgi:amino acid adenylation domain-containing protein
MEKRNGQIVKYFEEQVEKNKDKIAVKSINRELSYGVLNHYANVLACALRDGRQPPNREGGDEGVNPRIGILFEHDADLVVGILGVLKAKKTYVSLDPGYPEERMAYILKDSEIGLLVTNNKNLSYAQKLTGGKSSKIEIINLDNMNFGNSVKNLDLEIKPEHYANIMYTSGSTGRPKGVIQNHRNIVHFIGAYSESLKISSADRILLLTSYSHTVSAIDIFSALLNGAGLYIYDIKAVANIRSLSNWIKEEGITIYHSVPTMYRYLLETGVGKEKLSQVRLIVLGGEEVLKRDVELYRRYFSDDSIFINLFGSSELLIASSYTIDKQKEIEKEIVPIGSPVEGVEILLLDEEDEKVGVFGVGELVYKSDYLSPGYWGLDNREAGVFVKNPLDGESIVYRSGDLGRRLIDGNIEYLGRKDFQIKIRGNRVELGEIESILDHLDDVDKSVVTAFKKGNGEHYLAAYYTAKSGDKLAPEKFIKILSQKLPDYMLPAHYVFLEELPLTPNGKIDRKNLPEPGLDEDKKAQYAPPQDEIEKKLVVLWQEILEKEKVGIYDNFFQAGGHSLSALTLLNKIYQTFSLELSLSDFMENQTISKLAENIRSMEEQAEKVKAILSDIEQGGSGR